MTSRLDRLLGLIQATGGDGQMSVPLRLCMVCADAVGVDCAGVSLISPSVYSALAASDGLASEVEVLQATLGEGPCHDAVSEGQPVLAPDLMSDDAQDRWPTFARSALQAGVRSVFGFPITSNGSTVGALDMYSRTPCSLSDDELDDALVLADLTSIAVHDLSDRGRIAEVGLSSALDEPWAHRSVVHHATGMTAVHLGVDVTQALLRLRAYAFAAGRTLADVAADVVARRMRIESWEVSHER